MEHNIATNSRQQQQARDQQLSQKIQEQQQQATNNNESQQQFCLRWHNHQTSLLSTLPILLDQSHLTDVTISAEGRTLRAHRVVLSACSSFFLEIFRTLETTHHPVIIIPGASFSAIVALLTFMYSGEVNVYEEQIPMLLSLAETLGIKGLADVHNNLQKPTKSSNETKESLECKKEDLEKSQTPPSSPQTQSTCGNFSLPQAPTAANLNTNVSASSFNPLLSPGLNTKFTSPLENFFLKSLQFYPNLMHQPLNFSQTALNKTSELLAKYQQQCNLYQANLGMTTKDLMPSLMNPEEEALMAKRFCTGLEKKAILSQPQQHQLIMQQQKDFKRIDKIVENLRGGGSNTVCSTNTKHEKSPDNFTSSPLSTQLHNPLTPLSIKTSMDNYSTNTSPALAKSPLFPSPSNAESPAQLHSQLAYNISPEDQLKLQQHLDKYAQSCVRSMEAANENLKHETVRMMSNDKLNTSNPQTKAPSNSKLYATCFICHKQLSNQYNLRVHLETHQNVRYLAHGCSTQFLAWTYKMGVSTVRKIIYDTCDAIWNELHVIYVSQPDLHEWKTIADRYACNVCSHVSRSKDALRKHVSYRHPGAPSPCETEARRKRANKVLATQLNVANLTHNSTSSEEVTPTSPNTLQHFQNNAATPATASSNDLNCNESPSITAAQLNSAYQMFMPNQFHLAAAAANAAQQQQQQQQAHEQQQLQQSCSINQMQTTDFNSTSIISTSTHRPIADNTKLILNNSSITNSTDNTTPSNNSNELQISTNTNNSNVEARISPNIQT